MHLRSVAISDPPPAHGPSTGLNDAYNYQIAVSTYIADSTEQCIAVTGRAGSGKSQVLIGTARALNTRSLRFHVLAPTNKALSVLRNRVRGKSISPAFHTCTVFSALNWYRAKPPMDLVDKYYTEYERHCVAERDHEQFLASIGPLKTFSPELTAMLKRAIRFDSGYVALDEPILTDEEWAAIDAEWPKAATYIQDGHSRGEFERKFVVNVDDYFGFEEKPIPEKPSDVVALLDEGSMASVRDLHRLLNHYSRVIIFGDPNQLDPVVDEDDEDATDEDRNQSFASDAIGSRFHMEFDFRTMESFSNVRQFTDGILSGRRPSIVAFQMPQEDNFDEWIGHNVVVIAWTNKHRIFFTRMLRAHQGYDRKVIVAPGERVVVRKVITSELYENGERNLNGQKFYVNETFVVDRIDGTGKDANVYFRRDLPNEFNLNEIGDEFNSRNQVMTYSLPLSAFRFEEYGQWSSNMRYGYVMTAHTAQGSEWPAVVLPWSELAGCQSHPACRADPTKALKWAYTALSRARHRVSKSHVNPDPTVGM
jgi:AAA domain-containing protein/UvrD-like helicase family protein